MQEPQRFVTKLDHGTPFKQEWTVENFNLMLESNTYAACQHQFMFYIPLTFCLQKDIYCTKSGQKKHLYQVTVSSPAKVNTGLGVFSAELAIDMRLSGPENFNMQFAINLIRLNNPMQYAWGYCFEMFEFPSNIDLSVSRTLSFQFTGKHLIKAPIQHPVTNYLPAKMIDSPVQDLLGQVPRRQVDRTPGKPLSNCPMPFKKPESQAAYWNALRERLFKEHTARAPVSKDLPIDNETDSDEWDKVEEQDVKSVDESLASTKALSVKSLPVPVTCERQSFDSRLNTTVRSVCETNDMASDYSDLESFADLNSTVEESETETAIEKSDTEANNVWSQSGSVVAGNDQESSAEEESTDYESESESSSEDSDDSSTSYGSSSNTSNSSEEDDNKENEEPKEDHAAKSPLDQLNAQYEELEQVQKKQLDSQKHFEAIETRQKMHGVLKLINAEKMKLQDEEDAAVKQNVASLIAQNDYKKLSQQREDHMKKEEFFQAFRLTKQLAELKMKIEKLT